jgi:hypothetical protein
VKVIALEKANVTLPDVAEMAKKETVILTSHGKPLALVKDVSSSDWESVSLANNPRFRAIIEESRRSYREEGGIPLEQVCHELGVKPKVRPPRSKTKQK